MFIQTEATEHPDTIRFLPGVSVLSQGSRAFESVEAASVSPLAQSLFEIEAVRRIVFGRDEIVITKDDTAEWHHLKPTILGAIMEHFVAGLPVLNEPETDEGDDDEGDDDPARAEMIEQIRELVRTRIGPAVEPNGGKATFHSFKKGIVYLELEGSASGLLSPITNMIKHYVPEVTAVRPHIEAMPRPGLDTPDAIAIRRVLDEEINPAIAGHGGYINLIDMKDDIVYIEMGGGCVGCGMADVTLKQGVEVAIMRAVPTVKQILDQTDHASGDNPYYQPNKK